MKKLLTVVLGAGLIVGSGATLRAGGVLETIDLTGLQPSPIAGHLLARVIGIRWDARTIPVSTK